MPLDFPTSPALNELYTFNGKTWKWDGAGWESYNVAASGAGSGGGISGPYVISVNGVTGIVGISAGDYITIATVGQTLTISSSASITPIGNFVSSFNGYTGGITLFAGTGITFTESARGITLSTTGSVGAGNTGATGPTGPVGDYVISIDGATGILTNIARTNLGNTFSVQQIFNAGLSASGGATFWGTSVPVEIKYSTTTAPGLNISTTVNARIGAFRLGNSSTSTQNTFIYQNTGLFEIYNGNDTTGTRLFSTSSSGFTANVVFFGPTGNFTGLLTTSGGISASREVTLFGTFSGQTGSFGKLLSTNGINDAIGITTLNFVSVNLTDTVNPGNCLIKLRTNYDDGFATYPTTSTVQPATNATIDTTHTLPNISGTLLNNQTGVASFDGKTGAINIVDGGTY